MTDETHLHIPEEEHAGSLEQVGLDVLAYARPTLIEGQVAFAIHGADGSQLGMAPSRELAHAAMVQHGLVPVGLH